MKKLLAILFVFLGVAHAQMVNPNQIRPSSSSGQVLQTQNGISVWGPAVGGLQFCLKDYLYADTIHGGQDYGAAAQALVAELIANQITNANVLTCNPGASKVWTPMVFNWPVNLDTSGGYLEPQASGANGVWGSHPVTLTGCTLTPGNVVVTCSSTVTLAKGMAIGGVGIPKGDYVACAGLIAGSTCNPSSTQFTLQIPPVYNLLGTFVAGSSTIRNVSSLRSLAAGQTLTGTGIPAGVTIASLDPGGETAVSTQSVTITGGTLTLSTSAPTTFTVASSWIATLTAQAVAPVVSFIYNTAAPVTTYADNNIGSHITSLTIQDPAQSTVNSPGRSVTGAQGLLIQGIDQLDVDQLNVYGIAGTAFIQGGQMLSTSGNHGAVREFHLKGAKLYNDGDHLTGQAVWEIMTGSSLSQNGADENNTFNSFDVHIAGSQGPGLLVGTYNPTHFQSNCPRIINNYGMQVEGFMLVTGLNQSPVDSNIELQCVSDIHFDGGIYNVTTYGQSLFNVQKAFSLSVNHARVRNSGNHTSYTVTVANSGAGGNAVLTYVSGGTGTGFDTSGNQDGVGMWLTDTGSTCAAGCNVYSIGQGAATSTRLFLSAPYIGQLGTATLTTGTGGFFFNGTGLTQFEYMGNETDIASGQDSALYNIPSNSAFQVGIKWNNPDNVPTGICDTYLCRLGGSVGPLTVNGPLAIGNTVQLPVGALPSVFTGFHYDPTSTASTTPGYNFAINHFDLMQFTQNALVLNSASSYAVAANGTKTPRAFMCAAADGISGHWTMSDNANCSANPDGTLFLNTVNGFKGTYTGQVTGSNIFAGENSGTSSTTVIPVNVQDYVVTLTANLAFTMAAPTSPGVTECLMFIQGSGSYTVTPPSNILNFMTVSGTSGSRNYQCLQYVGVVNKWVGAAPATGF